MGESGQHLTANASAPDGRLVGVDDDAEPAIVELVIPAHPRFVRVARMTASSIVSSLGGDVEDVEDLRIVVDEIVSALAPGSLDGRVQLRFAVHALEIEVTASTASAAAPHIDTLSVDIVSAICSGLEITTEGGRARIRARKRLSVTPS